MSLVEALVKNKPRFSGKIQVHGIFSEIVNHCFGAISEERPFMSSFYIVNCFLFFCFKVYFVKHISYFYQELLVVGLEKTLILKLSLVIDIALKFRKFMHLLPRCQQAKV